MGESRTPIAAQDRAASSGGLTRIPQFGQGPSDLDLAPHPTDHAECFANDPRFGCLLRPGENGRKLI